MSRKTSSVPWKEIEGGRGVEKREVEVGKERKGEKDRYREKERTKERKRKKGEMENGAVSGQKRDH